MAGPGTAIVSAFKGYATFHGRTARSAYWWWFLFTWVVYLAAVAVDVQCGTILSIEGSTIGVGLATSVSILVLILPSLTMAVRRFHDSGQSGVSVIVGLFPFIGWLVLAALLLRPGTPGPNRYGAPPHAADPAIGSETLPLTLHVPSP